MSNEPMPTCQCGTVIKLAERAGELKIVQPINHPGTALLEQVTRPAFDETLPANKALFMEAVLTIPVIAKAAMDRMKDSQTRYLCGQCLDEIEFVMGKGGPCLPVH